MSEPTLAYEPTHVVYERIQNLLQTGDGYHVLVLRDPVLIETIKDRFGTNCLINSIRDYAVFTMHDAQIPRENVGDEIRRRDAFVTHSSHHGLYGASHDADASFTSVFKEVMKPQDKPKWIQQPLLELEELCHV